MASLPPIEIRWGGGKWPRSRRRAVEPTMRTAMALTRDGIEYLGVSCTEPKCAVVWCASSSLEDDGSSEGTQEFEVYVPYAAIKRRKVERWLPTFAITGVHEFLHCAREEFAEDTHTLLGRAADEGIANYGEFEFAHSVLDDHELRSEYPRVGFEISVSREQRLLNAMMQDVALEKVSDNAQRDVLHDAWFTPMVPGALSAGEVLGVHAVTRMVNAGYSFGEVIQMSHTQIFGVE